MKQYRKFFLFLTVFLAGSLLLSACKQAPADSAETSLAVTTVPEATGAHSTVPQENAAETQSQETAPETQPDETVPLIPAETTIPGTPANPSEPSEVPTEPVPDLTEDSEIVAPSIPEDTRSPIIVEIPDETKGVTAYEEYMSMNEADQKAFYDSFPDADAFFAWYNQAKADYEASNDDIIIDGSTNIEIKP